ncbi:hypothetical protein SAMN03159288_04646 [Rhizobium sp. NFACC06-2]|nr:hypothetical protein SAMN03159288_04646 [Rhizobium sp. NFACC06-2]
MVDWCCIRFHQHAAPYKRGAGSITRSKAPGCSPGPSPPQASYPLDLVTFRLCQNINRCCRHTCCEHDFQRRLGSAISPAGYAIRSGDLRPGQIISSIPPLYDLRKPLRSMASCGSLVAYSQRNNRSLRWRYPDDRQLIDPLALTRRNGQKRRAIQSHGSLAWRADTKVLTLGEADRRPIRLKLTVGQAHDGRSAAVMLETVRARNIFWPIALVTVTSCGRTSRPLAMG